MKEGYKQYLKKNMYGTACSKDLFKALEDVSGKPVEKVCGCGFHTVTT